MAKVFVVQEQPQVNITPAMDFGELVFCLGPGTHSLNPERMMRDIKECLLTNEYEPTEDHILLIGDPVAIGAACIAALMLGGSRVNVLKWDRQERRYLSITLRH